VTIDPSPRTEAAGAVSLSRQCRALRLARPQKWISSHTDAHLQCTHSTRRMPFCIRIPSAVCARGHPAMNSGGLVERFILGQSPRLWRVDRAGVVIPQSDHSGGRERGEKESPARGAPFMGDVGFSLRRCLSCPMCGAPGEFWRGESPSGELEGAGVSQRSANASGSTQGRSRQSS
jgi:hypothetical protein